MTQPGCWVRLAGLPVHDNVIDVRHNRNTETTLTNRSGPPLIWIARFYGSHANLHVGSKNVEANRGTDRAGRPFAWIAAAVEPGTTVAVRVSSAQ